MEVTPKERGEIPGEGDFEVLEKCIKMKNEEIPFSRIEKVTKRKYTGGEEGEKDIFRVFETTGKITEVELKDVSITKQLMNKLREFNTNEREDENRASGNEDRREEDKSMRGTSRSCSCPCSSEPVHIAFPKEELQIKEILPIKPFLATIYHIASVGETKAKSPIDRIMLTSIMGGLFIAFGMQFALFTAGNMEVGEVGIAVIKIIYGISSSVGIVLCLYSGADLFAGNIFVSSMALLFGKIKWYHLLKLLICSFIGNTIGAVLVAYFFTFLCFDVHDQNGEGGEQEVVTWVNSAVEICNKKINAKWYHLILRSIYANAVICVAVFLGARAKTGVDKFLSMIVPCIGVVGLGLEFTTSNTYFIPLGLFYGGCMPWYLMFYNLALVTVGNTFGGVFLVSLSFFYIYKRSIKYKNFLSDTCRFIVDRLKMAGISRSLTQDEIKSIVTGLQRDAKQQMVSYSLRKVDHSVDHPELRSI